MGLVTASFTVADKGKQQIEEGKAQYTIETITL